MLWVFGADGLTARNEMFAANRDAEALARIQGEFRRVFNESLPGQDLPF